MFAEDDLTIAIHARRGDIVNSTNAASRWTADTVYQTVLDQLLSEICRPEVIGNRRVLVNIFSEGQEVRASSATRGQAGASFWSGAGLNRITNDMITVSLMDMCRATSPR